MHTIKKYFFHLSHIFIQFLWNKVTKKYFFHLVYIFSFHTCDEFSCDEWPSMSWPITASKCTLYSLFFLSCFIRAYTLLRICSLYRGFLYCRDQKKCSLFRVGRCSLYRGLFTAKIDRGDQNMCSKKRCSLYRGVH